MTKEENVENTDREEKLTTLSTLRERLRENREKEKDHKKDHEEDDDENKEHDHEHEHEHEDEDDDKEEKGKKKFPFKKAKEKDIDEETIAGASLHPAARSVSDPKALTASKVEMMKRMVNHMAGMSKGDMTKWFEDTLKVYGPGKDYGVGDNSGKNSASIDTHLGKGPKTKYPMPKIQVREDLEELFAGTELSEEFKEKTAVLFEAAVHARVVLETTRLEEEFVDILIEEIEYHTETLTNKLDAYLDYTVENFMNENQIAVESTLRNELTTEFIEGLRNLFAEHYISVPEEQVDVLNALADRCTRLENALEDTLAESTILKDALINEAKQDVISEVGVGFTLAQQEKFATLAEGIEFDGDFDVYARKLNIVKESHFNGSKTKSNILEESFEGEDGTSRPVSD